VSKLTICQRKEKEEEAILNEWRFISLPELSHVKKNLDRPPEWRGVERDQSPLYYFNLMLPPSIFAFLLVSTKEQTRPPFELKVEKLYRWIAQLIVMMVFPQRRIADLWRTTDYVFYYVGRENGIARDTWQWLINNLQFNEQSLAEQLQDIWQSYLIPGMFVTIDEGRINANQLKALEEGHITYNKGKPIKWGIEAYTLHDTETRYLYAFIPSKAMTPFQGAIELTDVLKRSRKEHHITADSRFINIDQVQAIKDCGYHITGCCKSNNKPSILWKKLEVDLGRWRSHFAKKDSIVAVTYARKKTNINLLTSWFSLKQSRNKTNYVWSAKTRTPILDHYDATKRAADQFNGMVSAYHFNHAHTEMKSAILVGWLEWGLLNAYICYQWNVADPLRHSEFLLSISEALLGVPK